MTEEPGGIVSVQAEGDSLTVGIREDPEEHGTCTHPAPRRRLVDGDQLCLDCAQVIGGEEATLIPRDRAGSTDPTAREGSQRAQGGLRHVTWDPDNPAASRPYTPEEVELEIVDTLDRIERGAGWLTTKEEERSAAKVEHEIAYARALITAPGKSAEIRSATALVQTRDTYERLALLELQCRTGAQGMHNLRAKLSGLQSVLRSASAALSGGGGSGGWDR